MRPARQGKDAKQQASKTPTTFCLTTITARALAKNVDQSTVQILELVVKECERAPSTQPMSEG